MKTRISMISTIFMAITTFMIIFFIFNLNFNKIQTDNELVNSGSLPTINTKEKLIALLNQNNDEHYRKGKLQLLESTNYITTNIENQFKGIDEADLVKSDDNYIYSIIDKKVIITDVSSNENMNITATLFSDDKIIPSEMILDDNYLTVICNTNNYYSMYNNAEIRLMPYYDSNTTTIYIYDISDKSNITRVKNIEIDGKYLSAKKINNNIYVVTNKYIWNNELQDMRPTYKIDEEKKIIDYCQIFYFPDTQSSKYTMVGVIDLLNISDEPQVSAYLSSAKDVYISLNNLYISCLSGQYNKNSNDNVEEKTSIYKFSINNNNVNFLARAVLLGKSLNQIAMDEYNGYLRVTLSNDLYNSVYVLDHNMKVTGKVTGFAEGDKVYTTKFIKDRAYVATFKTDDPLFVIDLKNAAEPKFIGELKIPGYNSYIHEYDDDHIIGIGQVISEFHEKDSEGKIANTNFIINGMKMGIFDVTNVNEPNKKFSVKIGNENIYSDILKNPKTLLFSKEKRLLALPIDINNEPVSIQTRMFRNEDGCTNSSERFQGLLVYNIDLQSGFSERGMITHYEPQLIGRNFTYYTYNNINNIQRVVYLNNVLYTISEGKIKANMLDSLKEIDCIRLK